MNLTALAAHLCGIINPIFLVLILEEALLATGTRGERWRHTLIFWGKVIGGLGGAVVLAELGKAYQVWPGHPLFPSGHATFAVSAAICLMLQRGAHWAWIVVPLAITMMICLPIVGFHTWDEVAGGTVLGITVPLFIWNIFRSERRSLALSGGRPSTQNLKSKI